MVKKFVEFEINQVSVSAEIEPRMSLVDFIRHELRLTGTHVGCEHGVCGMCTVLVDGNAVKSCLMLAVQADGHTVETVESLNVGEALHPLQEAFRDEHGLQCGFCTPGVMMTAKALASTDRVVDESSLRIELAGNLCRCTGYDGIVRAVAAYLNLPLVDGVEDV